MEAYDPSNPSVLGSYYFVNLVQSVKYNLSNYLNYGDLLLVFDTNYIGRMSTVCNKLFCQSKINNGIIKVITPFQEVLGHLVLVQNVAYHFIPLADNGFAIDNQIIYKREKNLHWQKVAT